MRERQRRRDDAYNNKYATDRTVVSMNGHIKIATAVFLSCYPSACNLGLSSLLRNSRGDTDGGGTANPLVPGEARHPRQGPLDDRDG